MAEKERCWGQRARPPTNRRRGWRPMMVEEQQCKSWEALDRKSIVDLYIYSLLVSVCRLHSPPPPLTDAEGLFVVLQTCYSQVPNKFEEYLSVIKLREMNLSCNLDRWHTSTCAGRAIQRDVEAEEELLLLMIIKSSFAVDRVIIGEIWLPIKEEEEEESNKKAENTQHAYLLSISLSSSVFISYHRHPRDYYYSFIDHITHTWNCYSPRIRINPANPSW